MRTPTWSQVEAFCRKDGWEEIRETDHVFYRRVLENGTVLETHRSFSTKKTMRGDRFALILRTQLRVSAADFWASLRSGRPAPRSTAPPRDAPPLLPAWLVRALEREAGQTEAEIAELDEEKARRLLDEHRSRPRDT
jgi:hypothetical protein